MSTSIEKKRNEISTWFFETYFNHWVAVGSGKTDEGPEFILQYWGTPMYASVDEPKIATWMLEGQQIVDFLAMQHNLLKEGGYDHTHVPDKKVIVYNETGGAIEVIWSRQAADNTELQRFVVHFEVVCFDGTWKVVGMQVKNTTLDKDNDSIDQAWKA